MADDRIKKDGMMEDGEEDSVARGVCPLTCVLTAVHLQMGQLKVPLAAAGMSAYKRTLLAGLRRLSRWRSDARNPAHILEGEVQEDKRV